MAVRPKNKVVSNLKAKGFTASNNHHIMLVYFTAGGEKTAILTKTSHTPQMKDIDDNLLSQMAKQCRLDKSEFLDLVDCPMDRAAYERRLRAKKVIP